MKKVFKIIGIMLGGFVIGTAVMSGFGITKIVSAKTWITNQEIIAANGMVLPKGMNLTSVITDEDGTVTLSLFVLVSPEEAVLFKQEDGPEFGEAQKNIVLIGNSNDTQ